MERLRHAPAQEPRGAVRGGVQGSRAAVGAGTGPAPHQAALWRVGGVLTPRPPPGARRVGKMGREGDRGVRPPPQPRLSPVGTAASLGSSAGSLSVLLAVCTACLWEQGS